MLGSDIDFLVGADQGMPPAAFLVAGWVKNGASPAVTLAQSIMGTQDWTVAPTIRFPDLVLALYAADATAFAGAIQTAFDIATGVVNGLIDSGRFLLENGIRLSPTNPRSDRQGLGRGGRYLQHRVVVATMDGPSVPVSGRSEVTSLLQAGRAAVFAGAVDAGLDCLQRAAGKSSDASDRQLQAQALLSLGAALVHSVRGRDGEGSIVLHETLCVADLVGDDDIGASARRELAFVEVQAGRRVTAREWLAQASGRARCDRERAASSGFRE